LGDEEEDETNYNNINWHGPNFNDDFRTKMNQIRISTNLNRKSAAGIQVAATLDVLHDYQNRESCKEVTSLYRAANKLIKTLYIARTAMISGDDNKAILNYNEVASIF
jgi:hypothetical protein